MQLTFPAPVLLAALALTACKSEPAREVVGEGEISFYADSLAGSETANGETYDPSAATCAHRKLPFGTEVHIERLDTGAKATCVVNDRGPYADDRILDVSMAVAKALDFVDKGAVQARLSAVPAATKKE